MGVGTLIIFISLLLVAAVAAGVLISSTNSLQERALATGAQAEASISTYVQVVEITSTDGRDGTVEDYEMTVKLAPGSDEVKLDDATLTMSTISDTCFLNYRAGTPIAGSSGYFTLQAEDPGFVNASGAALSQDMDLDGSTDYISVVNSTTVMVNYSTDGIGYATGLDLTATSTVDGTYTATSEDGAELATLTFDDVYIYANNEIAENQSLNVTPELAGQGFFMVRYASQSTNFREGVLQRGDMATVYFQGYRGVGEDEELRISFIPKIGTTTLLNFITPEVISTRTVYLYP